MAADESEYLAYVADLLDSLADIALDYELGAVLAGDADTAMRASRQFDELTRRASEYRNG